MRFTVSIVVVAAMFLTSCAYEGVIVEKRSRPHPLYHSVGIEGVHTFVLRDRAGALHRQMVTPDVFEQYAEGDYFNDLQPQASRASDYKETRTAAAPMAKSARRIASTLPRRKTAKSKQVASETPTKRAATKPTTAIAKRTPSRTAGSQTQQAQRTTLKAKAPSAKIVAKARTKTTQRRVAKKTPKPWKMTEPTVETAPLRPDPAPPSEGPAPVADAAPAPQAPPAAKPTPLTNEADIVYIPPPPQ